MSPPFPGLARRLAAALYDGLLAAGLTFTAHVLVVLPLTLGLGVAPQRIAANPFYALFLCGVVMVFFCGFWSGPGKTLGMQAWRLRLVALDGGPVPRTLACQRFFAAILSWAALGLGFLWALLDPEGLTWHDRLSRTRLVVEPRA